VRAAGSVRACKPAAPSQPAVGAGAGQAVRVAAPASHTPAPASSTTVAPFRAWRGLRT